MSHSAIAHLPESYFQLAPELAELAPPEETTSDCAACPMVRAPQEPNPPVRMVFHPTARCCTYNPVLYNFLVGRALRRGGPGAEHIRRRMEDPDGLTAWTLRPPMSFYARLEETPRGGFGQDIERLCPYWAPEGLHCTIWKDRNAVCRSWFCKHDDGKRGLAYWDAFRDVIRVLQVKICRWLAELGTAPEPATATIDDWCAYYTWCAERLDAATAEEIDALTDPGLEASREQLRSAWAALTEDALPQILGPSITAFFDLDDQNVLLDGYSHYNPSPWPRSVFVLFSVMDGTVTWPDALAHARQTLGSDVFTEADIREMFRLGLLEARAPEDLVPGVRLTGKALTGVEVSDLGPDGFEFEMG